ncbi:MAG: hypothetical protein KGM17_07185 [Sphingomonadales bacterium]|nr:hypothetical protein [Sphingomonadales bacterium]
MNRRSRLTMTALLASLALAGCKSKGDIVVDEGVGITAIRSACPSVGVPDFTGDVTLFRTPGATDAGSIDLTAAMTNVRTSCDPKSDKVYANVSFDVQARRTDTHGARTVTLPFFVTVVRGGNAVVAKRISAVTLQFADGQDRASATGRGAAYIDKAEATLSREVRDRITRKRKAGDFDAAVDPLAQPDVRTAVARATFDVFVGFQLSNAQFQYNVTR